MSGHALKAEKEGRARVNNLLENPMNMNTPLGLPRYTPSLCPECLKIIEARLFEENGSVWMEKNCPEHGLCRDLIYSDAELFLKAEKFAFEDAEGIENPRVKNARECPTSCGLCNLHTSVPSVTNIDLTNRCNLTCPYCFANANVQDYVYEPDINQIAKMIRESASIRPKRTHAIQFSGGEPTLHPDFLEACRIAKSEGFITVQAATNGIKFAKSLDFCMKARDAGLNGIYLQFDGIGDVYNRTRGVPLWETKLKAIENLRKAGIRITLVPTLIKGVNDNQVGEIVKFAINNMDIIVAISFQPVAFTGRIDFAKRMKERYTLSDLAFDVEKQTAFAKAREDWYPFTLMEPFGKIFDTFLGADKHGFMHMLCSCHPNCGLSTYLLVNERTHDIVPLSKVIDIESALPEIWALSKKSKSRPSRFYATAKLFSMLMKYYRSQNAPKGLNLLSLVKTADALTGKRLMGISRKKRYEWRLLLIAGMHFQDAYDYQIERVKRCVVHYSSPSGFIYPFCTYNSGPIFRNAVEKKYSIPKEEWIKKHGGQFVCNGFYKGNQD